MKNENIFNKIVKAFNKRKAGAFVALYKLFIKNYHPRIIYHKLFLKDNLIRKNIKGSEMILDLNDFGLSRDLIIYGSRENWASKFFESELKKGMNILEIGANKGYFLLIEAKKIGTKGKIYALEPDPRNMTLLKKNIELNNLTKRVSLFDCSAGNKNKLSTLYLSKHHNASNLVGEDPSFSGRKIEIQEKRIDDLLKNKKIDYVRMDIEGYEFEVMKGMEKTLKHVKGMFLEVHPHILEKNGLKIKEFYEWLFKKGFYIKAIDGKTNLYEFRIPAISKSTNHVFFEKEKNV